MNNLRKNGEKVKVKEVKSRWGIWVEFGEENERFASKMKKEEGT